MLFIAELQESLIFNPLFIAKKKKKIDVHQIWQKKKGKIIFFFLLFYYQSNFRADVGDGEKV